MRSAPEPRHGAARGAGREPGGQARRLAGWLPAALLALAAPGTACCASAADLYRDALSHDPGLAAARAAIEVAREGLPQAQAAFLPVLTLSGETRFNKSDFSGTDRDYNSNAGTLALTQPLYSPAAWADHARAQWRLVQAQASAEQARVDLALRLLRTLFDLLEAHAGHEAARAHLHLLDAQLAQARQAFERGAVPITDVIEVQARREAAWHRQAEATNTIRLRRAALQAMTGREPPAAWRLDAPAACTAPTPADRQRWLDDALERSFALQASRAAQRSAQHDLDRARAARHPTVELVASYSRNAAGYSQYIDRSSSNRTASVGVQFSVPLYRGGYLDSKVREAVSAQAATDAEHRERQTQVLMGVEEAFLRWDTGAAECRAMAALQEAAERARDAARMAHGVGVRSRAELTEAEYQLMAARSELLRSRLAVLFSRVRLDGLAGQLDEAVIARLPVSAD